MIQDPECDRPENNVKAISEDPAGHVGDDIRDIRGPGPADERLQQLNAQAHQKAEEYRPAEPGGPVPGQREQEAEGYGHDNVQYDLSYEISNNVP